VHVEQWLPQSLLLPHTDLVVSHGGSGTVTAALAHGLPQLILPMGADQLHNADRVQELGIGRTLPAARATPGPAALTTTNEAAAYSGRNRNGLPNDCLTVRLALDRLQAQRATRGAVQGTRMEGGAAARHRRSGRGHVALVDRFSAVVIGLSRVRAGR
jgi:hypothetical protein